jgi:hypothetical protein
MAGSTMASASWTGLPLASATARNFPFRAEITFWSAAWGWPRGGATTGRAAPISEPGSMAIWRQERAMRAPAEKAFCTTARVGRGVCRRRSEIRMAASTLPPGVSMRRATPLAPSRSARERAWSTKTAKAGSISPWMGMR